MDFERVKAAALARAEELLPAWLPGGKRRGHEWVCGSLKGGAGDSCSTNLTTGRGSDFASGEKWGDLVSLWAQISHQSQGAACSDLALQFGMPNGAAGPPALRFVSEAACGSAPQDVSLPGAHPEHGAASSLYRYVDAAGALLFLVARFDLPQGKQFCPYTWRAGRWAMKAYPAPRPLYGLTGLLSQPDLSVLVVEGEKCRDAADGLLSMYAVVTWAGGAQAVKSADWTVLAGRDVLLWPDADGPGREAMARLAAILLPSAERVRLIDTADQGARGWDLGDAIASGWDAVRIAEWARPRVKTLQGTPKAAPSAAPPSSAVVSWQSLALDGAEGGKVPHATLANAARVLEGHPEFSQRLWFDAFRGKIFYDNRLWTDADDLEVTAFMQQRLHLPKFGLQTVSHAVQLVAHRNRRNSVTDWLSSLKWDGTERLSHWASDYLGCPHTPYAQAVGRNWLISMVARAFRPGCQADHMPVLEGVSGRGKSSALAILGGEWYRAAPQAFGSKEFFEVVQGAWLIEIPDMVGFGRREHSQIISAITTRSDSYRASYGRHAEEHPRTVIFVATSETDEYLQDSRGIRRYWPLRCGVIELIALAALRDSLFAEAVAAFKAGATWHEMPESETGAEQQLRQEGDPWMEQISVYAAGLSKVLVRDIAQGCLEIEAGRQDRGMQMRIAKCLKALGFSSKVEWANGAPLRVYRR